MNIYIESLETDPYHNLAMEQFVFDNLSRENNYFMLWQNRPSIIVGKHQNTGEEVNHNFVKEHNIAVVRRLSGGGAVYHDLGNLNFTFISSNGRQGAIDFSYFCKPICEALSSFGVPVVISGRNDMTVNGKKFSGNAQYIKNDRVMHHGTILYDSDLDMLSEALKPGSDKIESRGIKSIQSRVTNIKPYMKTVMPIAGFWSALKGYMSAVFRLTEISLTSEQIALVRELSEKVYSQWSWNYGNSPPHSLRKTRRIEGCGKIEILLDIGSEGKIKNIAFYGDFFGSRDPDELKDILKGNHLEYDEIRKLLKNTGIHKYFNALDLDDFLSLLFS
jgi:lipoate-protein ligase A